MLVPQIVGGLTPLSPTAAKVSVQAPMPAVTVSTAYPVNVSKSSLKEMMREMC